MSGKLRKQVRQALADETLQAALSRFTMLTKFGRQMGMTGIDFEALRQDLHERKAKAIDNLPALIEEFKANAAAAGAVVFEAGNAGKANDYIAGLARRRGIRHIIKSKSMLTEEIGLRHHLERTGIRVDETDIGERIVQLAREKPAHIVGPAIHKTTEQIASLFTELLGEQVSTESQPLLDTVRQSLRRCYLDADMGISGANIAIAETGTIVILTNEGNGQLVTTLSPLHVAVVGIEKIMPVFEDANAVLRLLSRSCVGTKMTVYTSFITGTGKVSGLPLPGGQGPRELHIVLVDNGRSRMRDSDDFREALYCIKCGVCLNVCPVFASLSGQTYGHVYQGGIGTVLTAFYHDRERSRELSEMCLGCMSCKSVCPAGIDIPGLIRRLRAQHVRKKGLPAGKRWAYSVIKHPARLESAVRACAKLQGPFLDADSMINRLPYPLNSITDTISLPGLNINLLRSRLTEYSCPAQSKSPKVAFYSGCVTSFAYPELGEDVMRLLEKSGLAPYYPQEQACCGAPAYFSGDYSSALALAQRNIEALSSGNPDYIVTVCPGCAVMLKKEFLSLTTGLKELHEKAVRLSEKVRDLSQLLAELGTKPAVKVSKVKKVTYHDPCHLKRGLGISAEPRQLIEAAGYSLVEMNDADACCGFGGDTLLAHPELCGSILRRKLANIKATGVDTVVTGCTACVLQLRGGLHKNNSPIKVVHIARLLAGEV
ncbi:MAG: L-lactate dehydrogenase (quinone) large subunit LdhH [Dehalococcoidia bacterium]|jgi:L-lactate utilization protein LutB/heterodisulfide reductase subunit B